MFGIFGNKKQTKVAKTLKTAPMVVFLPLNKNSLEEISIDGVLSDIHTKFSLAPFYNNPFLLVIGKKEKVDKKIRELENVKDFIVLPAYIDDATLEKIKNDIGVPAWKYPELNLKINIVSTEFQKKMNSK